MKITDVLSEAVSKREVLLPSKKEQAEKEEKNKDKSAGWKTAVTGKKADGKKDERSNGTSTVHGADPDESTEVKSAADKAWDALPAGKKSQTTKAAFSKSHINKSDAKGIAKRAAHQKGGETGRAETGTSGAKDAPKPTKVQAKRAESDDKVVTTSNRKAVKARNASAAADKTAADAKDTNKKSTTAAREAEKGASLKDLASGRTGRKTGGNGSKQS